MLKGVASFLLVGITFFLSSCATYQTEMQEEGDASVLQTDSVSDVTPLDSVTPSSTDKSPVDLPPEYRLGAEDVIQVVVWKDDALTRTVTIRPDGKISLPLVGEMQAADLTPRELADGVKKGILKFYKDAPEVSVIVLEINSFSFFVLGEVTLPGKHILRRETTLLQAFSIAGGFKEYADTGNIILLRREGATEKRFEINYKKIIREKNPEDNLLVQAGDTLIVP